MGPLRMPHRLIVHVQPSRGAFPIRFSMPTNWFKENRPSRQDGFYYISFLYFRDGPFFFSLFCVNE